LGSRLTLKRGTKPGKMPVAIDADTATIVSGNPHRKLAATTEQQEGR